MFKEINFLIEELINLHYTPWFYGFVLIFVLIVCIILFLLGYFTLVKKSDKKKNKNHIHY